VLQRGAVALALVLALGGLAACGQDSGAERSEQFHSPDNLPPASWRPFADSSPWNQRIPADARVDPRSDEIVRRLLEAGPPNEQRLGTAGTDSDFTHAVYFANESDPLYRVQGGSDHERYGIDGRRVRLPDGAEPSSGDDHHLAVVYDGEHWGCYGTDVDHERRIIRCESGRRVPIDGDGLHAAETAARFPSLAGRIRFQELDAGRIRHALFATSSQIASTHVFPAEKSDGERDAAQGYPPMGTRFQLDPDYMTEERLKSDYPPWKRALLRAVRDYGFYLGDSTASPLKLVPIESGTSYTSLGLDDPWQEYGKRHDLPIVLDSSTDERVYAFQPETGIDWTRLRVIEPCVTERTC
jgi:hypothetical protein